jgi:hypothetical protein
MRSGRAALLFALAALFVNSLDCYGAWITSSQARDCCRKGHCSPASGDPCCKGSLTQSGHALQPQKRIPVQPQISAALLIPENGQATVALQTNRLDASANDLPPPLRLVGNLVPLLI